MKLFQRFFKKGKKQAHDYREEEQWEELSYRKDNSKIYNSEERKKYVEECLVQMKDASVEIESLSAEYNLITTYLTDMEEVEQFPQNDLEKIRAVCTQMVMLGKQKTSFQERKNRITEEEYKKMFGKEDEAEEGIKKIMDAEQYQNLIKADLRRLDGEKSAYCYRRNELENELVNLKGIATIIMGAVVCCFLLLMILQFVFQFDTQWGYILSGAAVAVVITVLFVKFSSADRELSQLQRAMNRLIQLHNTVKIRYVNNTSLLEYLYVKYGVESGKQFESLWKNYQEEKKDRQDYQKAQMELDSYEKELLKLLNKYNLKQPQQWLSQPEALLDSREMVEIRHRLIVQRQKLRKRLEYNREIAKKAKEEIMDLAKAYPQFKKEILSMVEQYEKLY